MSSDGPTKRPATRKLASPRRHANPLASARYEGGKDDFLRRLAEARRQYGSDLVDLTEVKGYEISYILRFAELWHCREGKSVQVCLLRAVGNSDLTMLYGLGDKRAEACQLAIQRLLENL